MHETTKPARRVIALGFFDGVHIGHGALLRRVVEVAAQIGAVPSACTFDTHPEKLIFHSNMPLLSTPYDRACLMRERYQIQDVIIARFDTRMMRMPWQEFVTEFLVREHGAVHVVAGHDFHFGYQGTGNPERLSSLCREIGIGCDTIPRVEQDHITVSSTYIRTLVAQGEMERAAFFLGHPHTISAHTGRLLKRLGGEESFSLRIPQDILPPARGIYAGCLRPERGGRIKTVINVGAPPEARNAITCLPLERVEDLEGREIRLELHKRLRGREEVTSPGELRALMERDANQVKSYFAQHT